MFSDKKTQERVELGHRLGLGLGMACFNQGLVQFADSKANGLVVVNSIFLASMVGAIEGLKKGAGVPEKALGGAFFVLTVLALLASLRVMLARSSDSGEPRPRSFLFYKHILAFTKASSYVDEVGQSEGEKVLESLLYSNYDLAGIVAAKFRAYKTAETLTLLSAVLWVMSMIFLIIL